MNGIRYLLKFGQYQHIKEFAAGNLFCSNAQTFWGIESKNKIKGQGDVLEAGTRIYSQQMAITDPQTNRTVIINTPANGLIHYGPIDKIPVFCLFAVDEADCQDRGKGENKIILSDTVKNTIREHFPKADSVAIIRDPDSFIQDVRGSIGSDIRSDRVHYFYINNGIKTKDGKVALDLRYFEYMTQDSQLITADGVRQCVLLEENAYRALFCKDVFFKDEHEYRIILPNERIENGKGYRISIKQTIDVMSLEDFFKG